MHCLTPRLSSPLWLGPAYLAPRSLLVCVREKAILFDSCSSFASSSWAHPGEVFLANSVAEPSHGFSMASLDCGAVESHLLRLANSTDLQVNPGLIVVDLDAVGPVSPCRSLPAPPSTLRVANGPGCIPWNSSLRPCLFPTLPVCKMLKRKQQHGERKSAFLPFVPGWLYRPVANGASHHCWWASHAHLTQQRPATAMREAMGLNLPLDVFSPVTNTQHVQLLVSALPHWYPTGLLVLHKPAACCLLFLPSCPAQKLTFAKAGEWLSLFPATHAMVYTQPSNVSVGHYEACQVLKAPPFDSVRANCPRVNFCLSSSAVNPVSCPVSTSSLLHMAGGAFRLRFDRSINLIDLDSWEPRGDVAALPCQSASVPMPHCVDLRSPSSSSEHLAEQVPGSRQCFASLVPSGSLQCIDLSSDTSNSAWQLAEPVPGSPPFCGSSVPSHQPLSSELSLSPDASPLPWQSFKSFSPSQLQTPHPHGCLSCSPSSVDLDFDVPDVPVTWLDSLSGDSLAASHVSSSPLGQNPCEVCRMFGLLECLCLRQVSVPSAWLHGCSCVGVYGVCVCGYIDQTEPLRTSSDVNGAVASSSAPLTPLPWQPSIQPRSPQLSSPLPMKEMTTPSPTLPFSLDLSVPATWLDPLRPAFSLSPALSPASLTPSSRPAAGVSDCDLCASFSLSECLHPRWRVSQSPSMSQERDTLIQIANSSGEGSLHASASSSLFVSAPCVDFAPPPAHAELASVPKQSPLPFFPKWLPSNPLPDMRGAGRDRSGPSPSPQSPPSCASDELVALLLSLDVPFALAKEAARRFPHDLDAALDWACSSDRRHCVARSCIDLTTPPTSPNAALAADPNELLPRSSSGLTYPPALALPAS